MASNDISNLTTFIYLSPAQSQNMHYPSSPTEAIVSSTSDTIFAEDIHTTGPYLEIVIQPTDKFRFRYRSETGSHGKILGECRPRVKKTFPTVKLRNYKLSRKVFIKVGLYTPDNNPRPHVLELVGKECQDGVCYEKLDRTFCAKFQDLGILNKKKDEVLEILKERKKYELNVRTLNEIQMEEIQDEAKNLNLNAVKLGFEAVFEDNLAPVPGCKIFSNTIFNLKSTFTGDLGICRLSMCSGKCSGGEEMILLCNKIKKDEIKILFIEKDESDSILWSAEAPFKPSDVHHQVAIPFRTPKYKGQYSKSLVEGQKVAVWIQLYRKSDEKHGKPLQFYYWCDRNEISKKRKLSNPPENCVPMDVLQNVFMASGIDCTNWSQDDLSPGPLFDNVEDIFHDSSHSYPAMPMNSILPSHQEFVKKDAVETEVEDQDYRKHAECIFYPSPNEISLLAKDKKSSLIAVEDNFRSMSLKDSDDAMKIESDRQIEKKQTRKEKFSFGISKILKNKKILYYSSKSVSIQDSNGNSLLNLAIMEDNQDLSFITDILKAIPEDLINHKNLKKETPLHLATLGNHAEILKLLLHHNGNPHLIDIDGNNCMHLASIHNSTECMQELLTPFSVDEEKTYSPDINSLNFDGMTPLHLSVINNSEGCMKLLLNAKADVNIGENKCGRSPLHLAVEFKSSFINDLLLQPDIDVEVEDYRGYTALQTACKENDISYENLSSEIKSDKQQMALVLLQLLLSLKIGLCISVVYFKWVRFKSGIAVFCCNRNFFLMELFDDGKSESSFHSAAESITESEGSDEEDFQCKIEHFLNSTLEWKTLGLLTGADKKDLDILGELEKNPAKALIEKIKRDNDLGDTKEDLLEILNMAGLSDAVKRLSE